MPAQIIDGKAIAQKVREDVAAEVARRTAARKLPPTLATVLVGDRMDSAAYVASKGKACLELGMGSISEHLPADATQEQVESLVKKLNADPKINGILVQLPMPSHIDEERVLSLICIEKDVDGFSPINIGRLAQKGRLPLFVPCTPYGCIYLLEQAGVKIEGANAVVLGRSNIVGMPVALLLIGKNATVTVCHSRTHDLPGIVRQADILIAALGKAMAMGEETGYVQLVADKETDLLLGASMMGAHVTDVIHEVAVAIQNGITVSRLGETIHAHPTIAEAVMEAAHDVHGESVHIAKP